MKLRRQRADDDGRDAGRPFDDAGGHGAEYVDTPSPTVRDEEVEDRTAWARARHWTPERDQA
jgi:hypothetical protein